MAETKWRPIGETQVNYGRRTESITAVVADIFWHGAVMKLPESVRIKSTEFKSSRAEEALSAKLLIGLYVCW